MERESLPPYLPSVPAAGTLLPSSTALFRHEFPFLLRARMRARTRMHIDAHTVRDVQKEHAKSASPRRTRILFPLLLPYSPTNSLPFPTNAQIKNARYFCESRSSVEREGRERKGEKEKERKIGEALSFHLDETPLQSSTALSPREFPSSFISRHERKKKKVGASRIEHATPSVATLVNFKIAQDDSNKLSLCLFALVFRSPLSASTSASWRTFLRTYMGPLYPACPRWWWMVAMVRPVHWRRCGGTSRSQRAEPP